MISEWFETILRLGFYGTVAGVGVFLVSLWIDRVRAPRWISLALWGLVGLRLVCPFTVSSAASLLRFWNFSETAEGSLYSAGISGEGYGENYGAEPADAPARGEEYGGAAKAGNPGGTGDYGRPAANDYGKWDEEPIRMATYGSLLSAGAYLWLAGVIVLWTGALASYLGLRHRLRFAMKLSEGVYETDGVSSPCVLGVIAPRIYLLPDLTECQREHILLHERMHMRYGDPLWKILSYLAVSLHWFNPLLWCMYRFFQGELEKACDERVLVRLGMDKKEDYGESLLALARGRRRGLPTPVAFGEGDTKGRVRRILSYRKPLTIVSAMTVFLAIGVCAVFFTTPALHPETQGIQDGDAGDMGDDPGGDGGSGIAPVPEGEDDNPNSDSDTDKNDEAGNPDNDTDKNDDSAGDHDSFAESVVSNVGSKTGEVYDQAISEDGTVYQAEGDGIYLVNGDGRKLIYPGFPGISPQMGLFEGRLYFLTDASPRTDSIEDWRNNAIRWINLETLETGDLTLGAENRLITDYAIYDGYAIIHYGEPEEMEAMMLYHEGETVMNGKGILDLSETQSQRLGLETTRAILQSEETLFNISHRVKNQNVAYLDMDGDGNAERIILEPSPNAVPEAAPDEPLRYFRLRIGGDVIDGYGYNVANILWAIRLDKAILLAIYEDGPSADPYTRFYGYENGKITEVGAFEDYIGACEISPEGIITGGLRREIVQTDFIEVSWRLEDGVLKEIPQETYDFLTLNYVELLETLPLHTEIGSEETFFVEPQEVRFLKCSADGNWILVETGDGRQGWAHIENYEVVELEMNVMDVFEGRYLAG